MLLLWMLRTRMLHERPANRETANKLNPSTRRRRSLFTLHFSSPKSKVRRDQTTSPTTHTLIQILWQLFELPGSLGLGSSSWFQHSRVRSEEHTSELQSRF